MESTASPLISIQEPHSSAAYSSAARVNPDSVMVREKLQGRWREYSDSQWRDLIKEIAGGLSEFGVGAGTCVAVICDNHPLSVLIESAARSVGAVVTLLNCRTPSDGTRRREMDVSVFVVDDEQMLAHIREGQATIDGSEVRYIIVNPKSSKLPHPHNSDAVGLAFIQELGKSALRRRKQFLRSQCDKAADHVIFTSEGSGRQTRFVRLSLATIECASEMTAAALQMVPGDEILSSIPVHTVFGYAIKAAALQAGARFNFPELRGSLLTDLIDVEPSILIGSGRLWKELFLRVQSRVESAPRLHRAAFRYFMSGSLNRVKMYVIAKPLIRQLGLNRVRQAFSTDFVSYQVRDLFFRLGIQIVELYEIPEFGGVVANVIRESAAHPVLYPIAGSEIELHSDSRIGVDRQAVNTWRRGGVSELNCSKVVSDDIGRQRNGHIEFCGARHRVITLSDGTQVIPESIEADILEASTLIRAVVLVGEGRQELGTIVVLERDPLIAWAVNNDVHYTTIAELCANPQLNQHVRTIVEGATPLIKRFAILQRDPDYDLEEVSNMDRVWPSKLIDNCGALIERMYSE